MKPFPTELIATILSILAIYFLFKIIQIWTFLINGIFSPNCENEKSSEKLFSTFCQTIFL